MLIAQISDLHLRADGKRLKNTVDTQATLDACLDHLAAMQPRPDVVLATGDLAHDGKRRDYRALREAFDGLPMPVYPIPGNHDHRGKLRDAFADRGVFPPDGPFLNYVIEDHPLRLVGLDTVMEGADGGEFCAARRDWLDRSLAEAPTRPTLIFMHHPPFATGIGFMDATPFAGAAETEAVVRRHSQVVGVVCGHMHRAITVGWGGTVAMVAPSIVFQMVLDLARDAPSGFVLEPPAVPLYLWRDDAGLIAHMSLIGDFGPRHPFHPPAD